jgi:hypothetical protein
MGSMSPGRETRLGLVGVERASAIGTRRSSPGHRCRRARLPRSPWPAESGGSLHSAPLRSIRAIAERRERRRDFGFRKRRRAPSADVLTGASHVRDDVTRLWPELLVVDLLCVDGCCRTRMPLIMLASAISSSVARTDAPPRWKEHADLQRVAPETATPMSSLYLFDLGLSAKNPEPCPRSPAGRPRASAHPLRNT